MRSIFSAAWKYGNIIPVHKKGSHLEKQNYHPVSILSPLSKILERILFNQSSCYFIKNNSHVFRTKRSSQTALVRYY